MPVNLALPFEQLGNIVQNKSKQYHTCVLHVWVGWVGVGELQNACLPGAMPQERPVEILKQRLVVQDEEAMTELLKMEGVDEVLAQSDVKELDGVKKTLDRKGAADVQYRTSFLKLARARASSSSASGSTAGLKGFEGKAFPKRYPEVPSDYSAEQFMLLLPPGVKAQKELFHGRWRLFWKSPLRSRSATWQLYGFEGSVKRLAQEAWTIWEAEGGAPCPIEGLLR